MSILKRFLKAILPNRIIDLMYSLMYRIGVPILFHGLPSYNQDGLATIHNCDFMKDKLFVEAYALGKKTGSWGVEIHWRAYIICWAANKVKNLEGDFVECGVYKGGYSRAVIHYIDFGKLNKKFYLLDTFCGLSDKYISEEERKNGRRPGGFEECYESVKETFENFSNVEIIRGTIPDTLAQVKTEKIAYLSIDMNCALPEIAAAEYFWDKLVSGGIIVLDDYNYAGYMPQKRAFDAFASERGVQCLQLPTGQGLIFKP